MRTEFTRDALLSRETKACYHCGLPVPDGAHYSVEIGYEPRPMCCAGCAAVAQAIMAAGLHDYYAKRKRFPDSPQEILPDIVADLSVYDQPEIQATFVSNPLSGEREASLILEGITCPACVWLNETHLAKQPGVISANINYTTNRAQVRWDCNRTSLSGILSAIHSIGYRAYPYDAQALEVAQRKEARSLLTRFAIAGLGMMQVMMYSLPGYIAESGDIEVSLNALLRWAALVLTLPVVLYSSSPFFSAAWRNVRSARLGMDVPVSLAIAIAFAASTLATVTGRGEVYFDSVAMFVFLLLGARYVELRARQRASSHLESLSRALPATAYRLTNFPVSTDYELVAAASLKPGQHVMVRPGDPFPADGKIAQGATDIDEALLTGESMPVSRHEGEQIVGGSVNCGNPVIVTVQRTGSQTILAAIVKLIERAAQSRPHIQKITDLVAARFVVAVLLVAAGTALWWYLNDAPRMLAVVVSVLIVSCPCALALATPMALAVATGTSSRNGVLVTRSHALETMARISHFFIDKTGTLTDGRPALRAVHAWKIGKTEAIEIAAALEQRSEHPFATALRDAAGSVPAARELVNSTGKGIEGVIGRKRYRIGSASFVTDFAGQSGRPAGTASVWLADESEILAGFTFEDRLRPDAMEFVAKLRSNGIKPVLISGDTESSVSETARQLLISDWQASMSPDDKVEYVKRTQSSGGVVAMIGDGVNDAPVLSQAQVSVAMMSGTVLAQGAADMILLSGKLLDVSMMVSFARRTLRIVRQNLGWAIAYNLTVIPLAVTGNVTPWLAAIGMSLSSLFVVLNALRLSGTGLERRDREAR